MEQVPDNHRAPLLITRTYLGTSGAQSGEVMLTGVLVVIGDRDDKPGHSKKKMPSHRRRPVTISQLTPMHTCEFLWQSTLRPERLDGWLELNLLLRIQRSLFSWTLPPHKTQANSTKDFSRVSPLAIDKADSEVLVGCCSFDMMWFYPTE